MVKLVAVLECSAGNESVGNEWVETEMFSHDTTLLEVLKWAEQHSSHGNGRLMLTTPESEKKAIRDMLPF